MTQYKIQKYLIHDIPVYFTKFVVNVNLLTFLIFILSPDSAKETSSGMCYGQLQALEHNAQVQTHTFPLVLNVAK